MSKRTHMSTRPSAIDMALYFADRGVRHKPQPGALGTAAQHQQSLVFSCQNTNNRLRSVLDTVTVPPQIGVIDTGISLGHEDLQQNINKACGDFVNGDNSCDEGSIPGNSKGVPPLLQLLPLFGRFAAAVNLLSGAATDEAGFTSRQMLPLVHATGCTGFFKALRSGSMRKCG